MVQSMTGFGKAEQVISDAKFSIEIKSLNSKNIDLNIKLPNEIKSLEPDIRKVVCSQLKRGKIDVYVNVEYLNESKGISIDTRLLQSYMNDFRGVSDELSIESRFNAALKMPNVFMTNENELNDEEKTLFFNSLSHALERIVNHRNSEGNVLLKDFSKRIEKILFLLAEIPNFENERLSTIKNKLKKGLDEIQQYDADRFEQELVFYLEKLDITEEKIRLKNHCDYFIETLNTPKSNGKKLNFISQEIGREINTLGAKSNHVEMQKLVVQMKDELEKIKEQILNIV